MSENENEEFFYQLIRKNVKNINLRVKSDGSVVVSASPGVPEDYIDDFVYSKRSFIQKARRQMAQGKGSVSDWKPVSGGQVPYLGGILILQEACADSRKIPVWIEQYRQGSITAFSRNKKGEAVFCRDGCLYLYTQNPDDTAYNQQLYDSWQKIQAGILCRKISLQYYPVFQKQGIAYPELKIRKMSSRWGSCIPGKHKITFNSRLLEKPLESIEYVVVHEFSHFIHPNHSKAFYDCVEQVLPDWRSRKNALR